MFQLSHFVRTTPRSGRIGRDRDLSEGNRAKKICYDQLFSPGSGGFSSLAQFCWPASCHWKTHKLPQAQRSAFELPKESHSVSPSLHFCIVFKPSWTFRCADEQRPGSYVRDLASAAQRRFARNVPP